MDTFPQVRGLICARDIDTIEHMFDRRPAPTPEGADALARLDALVEQVARLCAVGATSDAWTDGERAGALRRLDRVAGSLATLRAAVVVAAQRAPGAVGPGDRDFVAALATTARTGLGEARREVRQAETLAALPAVADGVSAGRVPLAHLDALARVTEALGTGAAAEIGRPETQERLVRMAERQTVREFTASAARLVASFDPAELERNAAAQRRERFFVMSRRPEGTFLRGRLDHVSAESLRVALASVGQAPDDERTKPQADADALVALAERATAGTAGVRARRVSPAGTLLPDPEQDAADARVSGTSSRPTVSILVPAETFEATQRLQRARAEGERSPAAAPVEPSTLEDGTPVAPSELARLLCDSEVGRIVLAADGVPMDLGRTQRFYSGPQRRAVIVRDRQCAWNGCDVPAAYCEVHHIRWWNRHLGPTSVENGVLLCSHHHHVVHRLDLHIARLPRPRGRGGGLGEPTRYVFERRDGQTINAPPRTGAGDGRGADGPPDERREGGVSGHPSAGATPEARWEQLELAG